MEFFKCLNIYLYCFFWPISKCLYYFPKTTIKLFQKFSKQFLIIFNFFYNRKFFSHYLKNLSPESSYFLPKFIKDLHKNFYILLEFFHVFFKIFAYFPNFWSIISLNLNKHFLKKMNKIYLKFFINFLYFLPRYAGTQSWLVPGHYSCMGTPLHSHCSYLYISW